MNQPDIPLADGLRRYREQWPAEAATVDEFARFLAAHANAFERANHVGHFTGSSWLVSADGERVLLMHHRKLDRWLQPGGHAEGNTDLPDVALREAIEETGVSDLRVERTIFDLDRHRIPARGSEAEHWHYDVRYVVRAGADERFVGNHESKALVWRPVADVAADAELEESVRRMARKWMTLL